MTTITLEHVSKNFTQSAGISTQSVAAVKDISTRIPSGDVLAILGPSGCGKSTLLRMIAGIFKPDSGRVLYNDQNLENIPLRERGVGMVFQEGALIPHWEARRSVGFFLSLRQREGEVPERLKQISKITGIGLDQLLERRPGQKEQRWRQLLAEEVASDAARSNWADPLSGSGEESPAIGASLRDRVADLEQRVIRLEAALADLL